MVTAPLPVPTGSVGLFSPRRYQHLFWGFFF